MTSVLGISLPKLGISKQDITSPKNVALGGIAAASVIGGGVVGALRGSPLKGLAIGAGIAAAALGASLIGNASSSYRDGYCDYAYDPDCNYPNTYDPPYIPRNDYPRDYPDPSYPDTYPYPGGGTSTGDTPGY
jgi:hypothetical protein